MLGQQHGIRCTRIRSRQRSSARQYALTIDEIAHKNAVNVFA
ncbi:hypothetical protein [Escherichia coli]